jgi:TolA-binding protein
MRLEKKRNSLSMGGILSEILLVTSSFKRKNNLRFFFLFLMLCQLLWPHDSLGLKQDSLGLTKEGQSFLKQVLSKPREDQVSTLVEWLSQSNRDREDRIFLGYLTAQLAFDIGNYRVAEQFYGEVSNQSHPLSSYARTRLASSLCLQDLDQRCEKHLHLLKNDKTVQKYSNLKWEWFDQSIKIKFKKSQWYQAQKLLKKNKGSFRSLEQKKQIFLWEMEIAKKLQDSKRVCELEKEAFVTYPNSVFDYSWPDLAKYCGLTADDKRRRVKKQIFLGQKEKVEEEIKIFSQRTDLKPEDLNLILADFYLREGEAAKALSLIEKQNENSKAKSIEKSTENVTEKSIEEKFIEKKKEKLVEKQSENSIEKQKEKIVIHGDQNLNLTQDSKEISRLQIQALALARLQKFVESSNLYNKIYQLSLQGKERDQALFDKAFVLYQGAYYKESLLAFQQYLESYPKGVHSLEAQWYLGWVYFLNQDYSQARLYFEKILESGKYDEIYKVSYWLAKTYWELYFTQEAIDIMTIISHKTQRIYGYYSNSAQQWLLEHHLKPSLKQVALKEKVFLFYPLKGPNSFLLNFEDHFKPVSPSLDLVLKYFRSQDTVQQVGELKRAPSSELESVDSDSVEGVESLLNSQLFAQEFSKGVRLVHSLIEIGESELAFRELRSLYHRSSLESQKLILLKVFESLGYYNESARLAELYLLKNPKTSDRTPWLNQAFLRPYSKEVERYSKKFGVDKSFIYSIIRAESFFNPRIESPVHARGLMQLMPFTANKVAQTLGESPLENPDQLFDPAVNIRLGTAYLSRLLKQFDQNYILAAMAYNAGPHRVQTWLSQFGYHHYDSFIEHIPFKETRGYVKKVMGFMDHYESPTPLLGPIQVREVMRIPALKERWDDI